MSTSALASRCPRLVAQSPLLHTSRAASRPRYASTPFSAASRRCYATAQESMRDSPRSHGYAALAGGAVVFLIGYGVYRYSGAHQLYTFSKTKDPKVLMGYLRSVASTYAAAIPGAGYIVNQLFDQLDKLAETHGPEVQKFVQETYDEVHTALQKGGDVGDKVLEIFQRRIQEFSKLSGAVGSSVLGPLIDSNPQLKKLAGDSLNQLRDLAHQHGSEAQKIYDDAQAKLRDLTNQGLNPSTLTEAAHVVRTKLREAQEIAKSSGEQAWQEAQQKAQPYLDKMPDLQKYLDSALGPIKSQVGSEGSKLINDTYKEIEKIGKEGTSKESIQKAKKLIEERVAKLKELAKKRGGEAKEGLAGFGIPGLDKLSPDFDGLKKLAESKGPQAKELFDATLADLRKVLQKRGDEAKKLGDEASQEAKDKATS